MQMERINKQPFFMKPLSPYIVLQVLFFVILLVIIFFAGPVFYHEALGTCEEGNVEDVNSLEVVCVNKRYSFSEYEGYEKKYWRVPN